MKLKSILLIVIHLLVACEMAIPAEPNDPTNRNPQASFITSVSQGQAPLEVAFDASASSDSDGRLTSFDWNFGDNSSGVGETTSHTYTQAGSFTVTLTVTDNQGASATATQTLTVSNPVADTGSITGTISLSSSTLNDASRLLVSRPGSAEFVPSEATQTWPVSKRIRVVPGEVLVKFRSSIRSQALGSLRLGAVAFHPVRSLSVNGVMLYKAENINEAATINLAQAMASRPDVLYASPNYWYYPTAIPNDPGFSLQWHYPAINLPQAWDLSKGSASTVVAVIDTGIVNHPEFSGRLLPGFDFVSDPGNAADGDGRDSDPTDTGPNEATGYHGTHVAGTIMANTDNATGVAGVDWNAKLLPVRALGVQGGSLVDILEAVLWAAGLHPDLPNPNPADVLNLSLGGTGPCEAIVQEVYDNVIAAGKIVLVAAGNSNEDAGFISPANCDNVITVGATDFANARAPYSNFGNKIEVMAPGGDTAADLNQDNFDDGVLSLGFNDNTNGFTFPFLQGTSMATPHVAGVASLMKALKPDITQVEVLTALTSTARPLEATACNGNSQSTLTTSDCGAGLIDAFAALQSIDESPPPLPSEGLTFNPASLNFGTDLTEVSVQLINDNATELNWQAEQFFTDTDNPGDVLDLGIVLSESSGTVPANGSQTLTVTVDRSKATADGTYRLEVEFLTDEGTDRYDVFFTKGVTTSAPVGDLEQSVVLACFLVDGSCDGGNQNSKLVTATGSGSTVAYDTSSLSVGEYILIGWKDVNASEDVDEGDFFGFYSIDSLGATRVTPPAVNIDFSVDKLETGDFAEIRDITNALGMFLHGY